MTWEVFERRPRGAKRQIGICLVVLKSGTMSLNEETFKALEAPSAVRLWFDRSKGLVGIKASDPTDPRAYPVWLPKRSRARRVAGRAFLKHYGVDHSVRRAYPAKMQDGMLVTDVSVATTKRLRAVG